MLRLADEYTEADHDRALQRLADDIEQAMPDPAWADDDPAVRDSDGEPVDLGKPWTRSQKAELVLWLILACGVAALVMWGGGR